MPHATTTPHQDRPAPSAGESPDGSSGAPVRGRHAHGGARAGHGGPMMHGSYGRFAAMLLTSTAVMFGLMYSMVYRADHLRWSQTRFWMACYMGAAMTVVMLAFMRGMYANKRRNALIFGGAALVFAGALFLARSQATVGDVAWMKAMIPHHSIALTTSSNAHLSDPRVKRLARQIVESQTREIAEMEALIAELERR